MGLDFQTSFGGSTTYFDPQGNLQSLSLKNTYSPRFLIGGTHFWGHADFYIAIPLYDPSLKQLNQEVAALRGVETILKYYPLRIENNKLRPFIGMSFAPFYLEQKKTLNIQVVQN